MRRSFRLHVLSLLLRLVVKTQLSWMKTPQGFRRRFERDAALICRGPLRAFLVFLATT